MTEGIHLGRESVVQQRGLGLNFSRRMKSQLIGSIILMVMPDFIRIKPHHFVDIVTALGDGKTRYSPHPYGHDQHRVAREILGNPDRVLEMELGADDICEPCVHNLAGECDDRIDISFRPDAPVSKKEWNLLIDRRWCKALGLKQGDRLTANDFCILLKCMDRSTIEVVYSEIPPHMKLQKAEKLRAGVDLLLRRS